MRFSHQHRVTLFAASSIRGAMRLAIPVSLDELPTIDLLVFGSVAVTPSGDRVGKGEGYAELEFAVGNELKKKLGLRAVVTVVPDGSLPRTEFKSRRISDRRPLTDELVRLHGEGSG